jgi:hypothetical protein
MKSKKEFFDLNLNDHTFILNKGNINIFLVDVESNGLLYAAGYMLFVIIWLFSFPAVFIVNSIIYTMVEQLTQTTPELLVFYFIIWGHIYIGLFLGYLFNIFDEQIEYNVEQLKERIEETRMRTNEVIDPEILCNYRVSCYYIYSFMWPFFYISYGIYWLYFKTKKTTSRILIPKTGKISLVKNKYRKKYIEEFL